MTAADGTAPKTPPVRLCVIAKFQLPNDCDGAIQRKFSCQNSLSLDLLFFTETTLTVKFNLCMMTKWRSKNIP